MHRIEQIVQPRTHRPHVFKYSKDDRAYVCCIEGEDRTRNSMQFASTTHCRFLYIQMRLKAADQCTVTLTVRDLSQNRFHLVFCTSSKREVLGRAIPVQAYALLPLVVPRSVWTTLAFDLHEIVAKSWHTGSYDCLVGIEISPNCTLQRIFAADDDFADGLPKALNFPAGTPSEFTALREGLVGVPVVASSPKIAVPAEIARTAGHTARPSRLSIEKCRPRTEEPRAVGKMPHRRVVDPAVLRRRATPSRHPRCLPKHESMGVSSAPVGGDDEEDAFTGRPPKPVIPEEGELDLIWLEAQRCYYCPDNQKYYVVDQRC